MPRGLYIYSARSQNLPTVFGRDDLIATLLDVQFAQLFERSMHKCRIVSTDSVEALTGCDLATCIWCWRCGTDEFVCY